MDYSEDSCRSSYSSDYGSDLVEDYQGSGSYSGSSSSGETSNTIVSTSNTLRGHCESRVIGFVSCMLYNYLTLLLIFYFTDNLECLIF